MTLTYFSQGQIFNGHISATNRSILMGFLSSSYKCHLMTLNDLLTSFLKGDELLNRSLLRSGFLVSSSPFQGDELLKSSGFVSAIIIIIIIVVLVVYLSN